MSSYINFYLKPKADSTPKDFVAIGSFSRNNPHYEYGEEYCFYEKGVALTKDKVANILNDLEEEDRKYKASIEKYNARKALVATFNNSVEDKMEEISEIDNWIDEVNEIHECLQAALGWYRALYTMIDEYFWSDRDRANELLWFGIEWNPKYDEEEGDN